jgi:hypothetical protein
VNLIDRTAKALRRLAHRSLPEGRVHPQRLHRRIAPDRRGVSPVHAAEATRNGSVIALGALL